MNVNWNQQICLLTGATGGIGQEIARKLAVKGATLILTGRDESKLKALCDSLPGSHDYVIADITSKEGRDAIEDKCMYLSSLTMLINNAGISKVESFDSAPADDIEQVLNVNLLAPMMLTRQLLPLLLAQKQAHIINVGSAYGSIGFAGHSMYCASKFGLRGWTESLQREYAQSHIKFYYFAPRATKTAMNSVAVETMNNALGNKVDAPAAVANALIKQIEQGSARRAFGFPERFFARLNGVFPEIVDSALRKKLSTVNRYIRPELKEN